MDTKSLILVPTIAGLMIVGGAVAGYTGLAAAQDSTNSGTAQTGIMGMLRGGDRAPHVGGTISAINGTVITVTGNERHPGTFTVETSGARFTKAGASASLASFAVGDYVRAEGIVNGTNVSATTVTDAPAMGKGGHGMGGRHGKGPGVMGTVSAVNGSTITVTGMDGQSYTVDAASAKVQRMVEGSLSDIAVGDRIGAHGTVSGTTVTATNIMDDVPEKPMQ
jgi:hypothetical protein